MVFDSGLEDWAPAWSKVQPQIAKLTRACSYDRAGAGFSDPGPMPRTSLRIAKELHTALHGAGIAGPYILVGSAFGGDNVRTFAVLYMDEVAGMVMVDADFTDLEPKAMREREREDAQNSLPSWDMGKALPNTSRCHFRIKPGAGEDLRLSSFFAVCRRRNGRRN